MAWYCSDCFEDVPSNQSCSICGTPQPVMATIDHARAGDNQAHETPVSEHDIFQRLIDSEFFASLVARTVTRNKSLSKKYLDTLGRITVDPKKIILFDVSLQIGPLRLLLVPALFSPLPSDGLISRLVWGCPEHGERDLDNSSDCCGGTVILKRGKVPFVVKALNAASAGAACVIICQTYDIWPFQMTDSTERGSPEQEVAIPTMMVGKDDASILEELLRASDSGLEACIRCGQQELECAVCKEDFDVGSEVLKLPCRHVFHSDCISAWLEKDSTCPMCRHKMPSGEFSTKSAMVEDAGTSYFA